MTISRREFLISGAVLAGSAFTTSAIPAIVPKLERVDLERLDTLVEQAVSSFNTPGISLAIWKNGKENHSCYAGLANLETRTRVSDTSVFRVGSLTKQFAGALILKLVATGKLSLTDPAHKYLPFLAKNEPFTILELLNHTAGVRDGEYDTANLQSHSQIEQAQRIAQQDPLFDFRPGTAWLYSNANYILIGAIIEKATEKSLAGAASILLFQPLGLHHTAFDDPSDIVVGRASGYSPTGKPDSPFQNAEYLDITLAGAAGAMRSTASDLCRWHHALFRGDALPMSLAKMMTLPGRLRSGQLSSTNRFSDNDKPMGKIQYGLGLMLDNATLNGSFIVNHHGGINGFASYLASHLSSDLTYACLCNADTHPGLPFRDIRRQVFADLIRANRA